MNAGISVTTWIGDVISFNSTTSDISGPFVQLWKDISNYNTFISCQLQ